MRDHLMLEGEVVDERDELLAEAREECIRLKRELVDARAEAARAKKDAAKSLGTIKHQLLPWYRAMQQLFGEIEASGLGDDSPAPNSRAVAVWETWKRKLGGKQAEFIQALLEHGEMTSVQLKVATHTGTSTVPQVIYKLNQLGLITKNGGKYSLKQL